MHYALQLHEDTQGVSHLRHLIETSFFGQTFDKEQSKILVKRLEQIAFDPLIFDVSASIDASVSLAEIYQYGVLGQLIGKRVGIL